MNTQEIFDMVMPNGAKLRKLYTKRRDTKAKVEEIKAKQKPIDKATVDLLKASIIVNLRYLAQDTDLNIKFTTSDSYPRSSLGACAVKAYESACSRLEESLEDSTYMPAKRAALEMVQKFGEKYVTGERPCCIDCHEQLAEFNRDLGWVTKELEKVSGKYNPSLAKRKEVFDEASSEFWKESAKSAAILGAVSLASTVVLAKMPYLGRAVKRIVL